MTRTSFIAGIAEAVVLAVALALAGTPVWAAETAKGTSLFLVANPDMGDPLFGESVILMLPGPVAFPLVAGLIVNKPTAVPLNKLFPGSPGLKNRPGTAYFGGPVDTDATALLFRASQAVGKAVRLADDVYLSLDPGFVVGVLQAPGRVQDLRLYLGRAQWAPNQLHQEVLDGAWSLVMAKTTIAFDSDPAGVWHTLIERAQLVPAAAPGPEDPNTFQFLSCPGGPLDCPVSQ